MSESKSRALSIPVALSEPGLALGSGPPSSCERSRPRVFLTAVLALAPLGLDGWEASSSLRRASFSAFFRAASAAFSAAAALLIGCQLESSLLCGSSQLGKAGISYFLESSLAPFAHSCSSSFDFLAFTTASFCAAASAFFALPAAFLEFSPLFFGAMITRIRWRFKKMPARRRRRDTNEDG